MVKEIKTTFLLFCITILLSACGKSNKVFTIEGKLQNIDQASFYIYSPDGIIDGVDTVNVARGEFIYRLQADREGVLMIVFPNYSQQPIFVQPGKHAMMKGDVARMKELTVRGTKENNLMNEFRQQTAYKTGDEETKLAEQFILEHPKSRVAVYLLQRFFLLADQPDYTRAQKITQLLQSEQPDNESIKELSKQVQLLKSSDQGEPQPYLRGTSVNGDTFTEKDLKSTDYAVVSTFAPWNNASMDIVRKLRSLRRTKGNRLTLISICTDGNIENCRKVIKNDSLAWIVACPEDLFENTVIKSLSLEGLPAYVVIKNGRITKRGTHGNNLFEYLNKEL